MFNKLIVIAITLNIVFYAVGGEEQTTKDPLKTNINEMIYLLKKGDVERFLDQYSYFELFGYMCDELRSKGTYEEFLKILKDKVANIIIEDLKDAENLSPKINTKEILATFYIKNNILKFKNIDGNWRLRMDGYISKPDIASYIYPLF